MVLIRKYSEVGSDRWSFPIKLSGLPSQRADWGRRGVKLAAGRHTHTRAKPDMSLLLTPDIKQSTYITETKPAMRYKHLIYK